MGRISHQRDLLAAAQGYIRTIYVARLTGVQRNAVFFWPIEHVNIGKSRFYKWDKVLEHQGPEAIKGLGLPATANEALVKVLADIAQGRKATGISPVLQCGVNSPADSNFVCARKHGHNGQHQGPNNGPMWGLPATEKKHILKLMVDTADLYAKEPDVLNAEGVYPADNALSMYLGNPLKKEQFYIDSLPEYSHHVPSQDLVGRRKWKCDRAIQNPNAGRDWWQGEHVNFEGYPALRWSKLLIKAEKKAPIAAPAPPKPGEVKEDLPMYADTSKTVPVPVAPNIANPSTLLAVGLTEKPAAPEIPPLPPPMYSTTLPDTQAVPPPPIPAAPALPSVLPPAPPIPVPAIAKTMICKMPGCGHDISFHKADGCHAENCGCKQPAPQWYLNKTTL